MMLYSYAEAIQAEACQIFGGRERGLGFAEEMASYSMMRFLSSQPFTVDHLLSFLSKISRPHIPCHGLGAMGAVQDTINSSYFP